MKKPTAKNNEQPLSPPKPPKMKTKQPYLQSTFLSLLTLFLKYCKEYGLKLEVLGWDSKISDWTELQSG